uniref:ABC-type multidrug transport system, ATPase component n=1 Tax=uncultured bacterium NM_1663 TaxID=1630017 RepID=A0A0E3JRN9_9BACT|nr:ABC-type multidrug transport system, ATPase component [uncultured bacterium NM_1663]
MPEGRPTMLEIAAVTKTYGSVTALAGVDLTVARGEIVGLVGPNGAGKTTLVSIVAGLRRPDAGSVSIDGVDAIAAPARALPHLGFAPQELGVYPTVSARDNLALFADLYGIPASAIEARIEEVAEALDLVALLDRAAGTLSGGQRRRLHVAMALLHRPALLILDEPTAGVDIDTRAQLLAFVRSLAEAGCAVCYATHYLEEVEALDATVAVLDHGRLIARGRLETLLSDRPTVVELSFDGPAPAAAKDGRLAAACAAAAGRSDVRVTHDPSGSVVRVSTDHGAATAAAALAALGSDGEHVCAVEIVRPGLEAVYLNLTGRRYEATATDTEDADAVAA